VPSVKVVMLLPSVFVAKSQVAVPMLLVVVGFCQIAQQKPASVMVALPLLVMVLWKVALVVVMLETVVVATVGGVMATVVKVFSAP